MLEEIKEAEDKLKDKQEEDSNSIEDINNSVTEDKHRIGNKTNHRIIKTIKINKK